MLNYSNLMTNSRLAGVIFMVSIMLTACAGPKKLVETGDYDRAIDLLVHQLSGKKKKKAEYVQALEIAFEKATERDMRAADRLKAENRAEYWDDILGTYQRIRRRQELIEPLLPLVDKDGVKAEFRFVRVEGLEKEARENAANYLYDRGVALLDQAKQGDKYAARKAYDELAEISRYYNDYRNRNELMRKAKELGTTHVVLSVENSAPVYMPEAFERELISMGVRDLNDQWTVFYARKPEDVEVDYRVIMRITHIENTPSLVKEREYEDVKEIEDGFEYVLDERGNVMKDTSGNDIKVPRRILVRANVLESYQYKAAKVTGRLEFYDHRRRELIDSQSITAEAQFENYASTFRGDRRALSDESCRRIGNRPMPFPSDEALMLTAAERLKPVMKERISRSRVII